MELQFTYVWHRFMRSRRSGLSTYQQWAMEDVAKLGGDIFNEDWLDDEKVELETREEGDAEKGDRERQQLEAFAKERYPSEVLEKAHSRAASEATRHEAVDETVYVSDSDISDATRVGVALCSCSNQGCQGWSEAGQNKLVSVTVTVGRVGE